MAEDLPLIEEKVKGCRWPPGICLTERILSVPARKVLQLGYVATKENSSQSLGDVCLGYCIHKDRPKGLTGDNLRISKEAIS